MTLEELIKEWTTDSTIDRLDLIGASLDSPKLHAKYWRLYIGERAKLIMWMNEVKAMKLDKYEFLVDGPTTESPPGWQLPAKGRILKADIERYLDGDKDLLQLHQKVDLQKEKVKMLEGIVYHINTRNFVIKNAQDMIRFEAGER